MHTYFPSQVNEDVDIVELLSSPIGSRAVDSKNIVTVIDESSLPTKAVGKGALVRDHFNWLADSNQLKGETRFAVDGFMTAEQCRSLMDLELVSNYLHLTNFKYFIE